VKFAALGALARFPTDAALMALQRAAGDSDINIRSEAERSLKLWMARDAADEFLRKSELPKYYGPPIFLRMIDHGDELWVDYKKTFRDERIESPANLIVAYNKATRTARLVPLE
jgi:hypothetical protein